MADADQYVRHQAAAMIQYAPTADQPRLRTHAGIDMAALQNLAGETPLYQKVAGDRFLRKEFKKSGSQTTLLDMVPGEKAKTLREKVIMRHINIAPYFAWKKAFEAYDVWREQGFDYVPIEPILRVRQNALRPDIVDVSIRVIQGPSIAAWEKSGMFQKEINEQKNRIMSALDKLGIQHGHLHDNNFVLYFPRTKEGKPDILHPPRVYAIDFDMAWS